MRVRPPGCSSISSTNTSWPRPLQWLPPPPQRQTTNLGRRPSCVWLKLFLDFFCVWLSIRSFNLIHQTILGSVRLGIKLRILVDVLHMYAKPSFPANSLIPSVLLERYNVYIYVCLYVGWIINIAFCMIISKAFWQFKNVFFSTHKSGLNFLTVFACVFFI